MKPIKKFSATSYGSQSILESANINPEALAELVQKLGYNNIDEITKEKALLSKLEALLKEFSPKHDISEDDAEDIEDKIVTLGTPKSLEDEEGEKEEDGEVGGSDTEVAEDEAEEIEDEIVTLGEPEEDDEEDGEEVVSKDQEITDEVPAEDDDEEAGVKVDSPVAKRKILSFEDFIKEEEVTVNKNVTYQDDEEDDDNAVPVADSYETEEIEENVYRSTSSIKSFSRFVSESYLSEESDNGPALKNAAPNENGINVPITSGDGSKTSTDIATKITKMGTPKGKAEKDGKKLVSKDQEITEKPVTSKDESDIQGTVVVKEAKITEKEIKSDTEFAEYATEILKSAHGDKFDEAKAKEVIDGLTSKYKGDYGAMVGALQSSMGK